MFPGMPVSPGIYFPRVNLFRRAHADKERLKIKSVLRPLAKRKRICYTKEAPDGSAVAQD